MAARRKHRGRRTGRRTVSEWRPTRLQTLVVCSASLLPSLVIAFVVGRAMRGGAPVRIPLPLFGLALGLLLAGGSLFVIWWRTPRR